MKREGGYTVLETGLAIAMSTTLVLLTFGLAAMVGRGRFRDSLVTTQSFIKQQYNEVRSGINSRLTEGDVSTNKMGPVSECKNTAIPGNNNDCYIIGRLLTFDNDGDNGRVQVSFIIAVVTTGSKWPDSTKTGLDNLNVKDGSVTLYALTDTSGNDAGLNPTIKQMGGNSLEKVWLLQNGGWETLYDAAHPPNPGPGQNNMAILRSPVDGSLVVASKVNLAPSPGIAGLKKLDLQNAVTNMSQDDKLALAVRNSGLGYPGGVICIPGGDNPAGTSNNFNVAGGNWNWDGGLNKVGPKDVVDACKNMDQ